MAKKSLTRRPPARSASALALEYGDTRLVANGDAAEALAFGVGVGATALFLKWLITP